MTTPLPFCDLVMKGGITSGVVYPKLIARLAAAYRFKGIGGTSAGAIAAAGCAAAEFARAHGRGDAGFAALATLPRELAAEPRPGKGSFLLNLFQPAPALARHFAVLVGALNAPDRGRLVAGALFALLRQFWFLALAVGLAAFLLMLPVAAYGGGEAFRGTRLAALSAALLVAGWMAAFLVAAWIVYRRGKRSHAAWVLAGVWGIAAVLSWWLLEAAGAMRPGAILIAGVAAIQLPIAIGLAVAAAAAAFAASLWTGLHDNGFGLCAGRSVAGAASPALADWLTGYFNTLAGMDPAGRPLTFGELWDGPLATAEPQARPDTPAAERRINLEVMTTGVSQHMCYAIPFRDAAVFYFDPEEWKRLFPPAVMDWLIAASRAEGEGDAVKSLAGAPLLRLPANRNLPVVVAVRMSLSFPVLLSAVPLYARDFSIEEGARGIATRVWFSDGGIASNMPLHFFDAPLPAHPTFAVNLKGEHPRHPIAGREGRVYLPQDNRGGRLQHWPHPPSASPMGLARFLADIVGTMQNWRDQIQFPYPGYRDRIVQVSQRPDEGGLNLNMPAPAIEALSTAGEDAAVALIDRFAGEGAPGWVNHREVRLRTFLAVIEDLVTHDCLDDASWDDVAGGVDGYGEAERQRAREMLAALRRMGADAAGSSASLTGKAPRPRASLRITPRI